MNDALTPLLRAIVRELAKETAALVVDELRSPASHYGTGKGATLPPGKTRAWALRNLKSIPGARKVGRDWIVSVADFDAWMVDKASTFAAGAARKNRPAKRSSGAPSNDVDALAEEAFAAAGLRRIR